MLALGRRLLSRLHLGPAVAHKRLVLALLVPGEIEISTSTLCAGVFTSQNSHRRVDGAGDRQEQERQLEDAKAVEDWPTQHRGRHPHQAPKHQLDHQGTWGLENRFAHMATCLARSGDGQRFAPSSVEQCIDEQCADPYKCSHCSKGVKVFAHVRMRDSSDTVLHVIVIVPPVESVAMAQAPLHEANEGCAHPIRPLIDAAVTRFSAMGHSIPPATGPSPAYGPNPRLANQAGAKN